MHTEYERRYLIDGLERIPSFDRRDGFELIVQGYLAQKDGATLRIRRRLGMQGWPGELLYRADPVLEYKGPRFEGSRLEHTWETSEDVAHRLMVLAQAVVQKRRYPVMSTMGPIEVDEFLFKNEGLLIAEIESERPLVRVDPPDWCGLDITDMPEFDNERLAVEPISTWPALKRRRFGLS